MRTREAQGLTSELEGLSAVQIREYILMYRSEVDRLEQEQKEIMTELRLIESRSNQGKDDKVTEDLGELGRKKCKYTN